MCYAIQKEKRLCANDEIVCLQSGKCIPECSVCDGIADCGDDDDIDERNCWFAGCPEKNRRMCNGDVGCYSPSRVCDGEWNCGDDKEDERDCSDSCLRPGERGTFLRRDLVQCRDLKGCVKITKVCDGKRDCSDGADETKCDEFCSLHGLFGDVAFWKCRGSPGCVKGEFLCDGISDCEDGSDEDNCGKFPFFHIAMPCCILQNERGDENSHAEDLNVRQYDFIRWFILIFFLSLQTEDDVCESIGYWTCRSSLPPFPKCISRQERCDGRVDCRDFSDEMNCGYCGQNGIALLDSTPFSSFRRVDKLHLGHTGCIPIDHVCDGVIDHPGILGIHDETDCAQGLAHQCYGYHGWKCPGENTCLSVNRVCDSIPHCANGEDEKNCDAHCESIGGWRCQCDQLTSCYLPEDICDGEETCYMYTTRTNEVTDELQCADDEANCEEYCRSTGGFFCTTTNECIEQDRVCDGIPDCRYLVYEGFYMPHDEEGCDNCTGVWEAMATYIAGHLADNEYDYPYANEEGVYGFTCSTGECTSNFFFCDDRLTSFGCADLQDEQGCEDVRCLGRTCEETHKCGPFSRDTCDGVPDCLDFTEEKNCASTSCLDTMLEFGIFKEIGVAQYCDGKEDCRTGADESPRKCAMFTDRIPCIRSNRFISRNHICDGIPDCVDASDEDACIGRGACILPMPLFQETYSVEEGMGTNTFIHSSHELTMAQWVVEGLDDWIEITLEDPVQLTGVVVSGLWPSHILTLSLKFGFWTDCLTSYTEGDNVKIFQTPTNGARKEEHFLAIAVQAKVVRLTPQSWPGLTILEIGLLGCPVKEHRGNDKSCGEGWAIFGEHCYQKFSSPLVWWAAENYCQALDGHLVAVNTPQENEFLQGNIGNGWIGMKIGAVLIKRERLKIDNFTWSDGSPAGDAYKDQSISFDFLEYSWKLNDPFCGFLEDHGPWSLQPCSLIEKEFICEKNPSSYRGDACETTANYNYTDLQNVEETGLDEVHVYIPDMTVCDDCMARKTACGNIRCGSPDQYRCGLIYSPGYPTAFPRSVICLWTIDGPRGSFVTLLLLDVDLPGYSGAACTSRVLQIRDRFLTMGWNTIHGLCRGEGEQKRYLSSSNEMRLAMLATSHNADFGDSRGFMATFNISTFSTSRQVKNLPDDAGFICPCGWQLFRRNCYQTFLHHVPVNWEESDVKCRELGANLTSVADRAEMEFLHLLLVTNVVVKRIADPMLFIGLHDIYLNRTFTWTDGIPVTYMDWSPMDTRTWLPQPDGAKINFCVAIVMKNVWGTDQWYDVACDDRATRSFICKRAAARVTRPGDNA
ncbi:uncharacterized protein [Branchiostoma lanceolatum]|uniref:uncharacterized protein n=1 Tax=Branchiostoma lanceolatum TaxID=7740 RepID=UPI003453B003